jgi:hypothetical protein
MCLTGKRNTASLFSGLPEELVLEPALNYHWLKTEMHWGIK